MKRKIFAMCAAIAVMLCCVSGCKKVEHTKLSVFSYDQNQLIGDTLYILDMDGKYSFINSEDVVNADGTRSVTINFKKE